MDYLYCCDEVMPSNPLMPEARWARLLFGGHSVLVAVCAALALCALPLRIQAQAATPSGAADSTVQLVQPSVAGQVPPITMTLKDALDRAQKNDAQFLATQGDVKSAHEDVLQARAALLPNVNYTMQYLGTEGNGKVPTGRYVTNDGVHVYRVWGVLHQDLSPGTFMATGYHRATAAEALANAKVEIARRG